MLEQGFVDYYEALQVSPNADVETIAQVYRLMVRRFDPANVSTGDAERLRLAKEANDVLTDSRKRSEYDVHYRRLRAAVSANGAADSGSGAAGDANGAAVASQSVSNAGSAPADSSQGAGVAADGNRATVVSSNPEFESDRKLRHLILTTLYSARRTGNAKGVDDYTLEQKVKCPPGELRFNLWYLTAKEWIVRTDEGQLSITALGVDQLG